ncbi:phage tail fiber assembly protein [Aquitalea magnusonii]|uniref:Phage tail fiber assembly protein n=1 Tax=Aquitalea magnusonii TaxID=332411 RepID=A0A3G9GAC4_9NEIS|nr:tail fiber assembly protein [Aquitalea magnusonii]BBF84870.1 phage tail fiber assembly protein [Aquitalea magnusonii]
MHIYHYDPLTAVYLFAGEADPSPLEDEVWLIPAHATALPPPEADDKVAVFVDGAWQLQDEHRQIPLWQADGTPYSIGETIAAQVYHGLGPLPDWLTATPPPGQFMCWDHDQAKWKLDEDAQREDAAAAAAAELARRRKEVDSAIVPLQDAIDLNMATDSEKSSLATLKRRRVLLARVPEQPAYPMHIDWPD